MNTVTGKDILCSTSGYSNFSYIYIYIPLLKEKYIYIYNM